VASELDQSGSGKAISLAALRKEADHIKAGVWSPSCGTPAVAMNSF
jgi:hypothetical protein